MLNRYARRNKYRVSVVAAGRRRKPLSTLAQPSRQAFKSAKLARQALHYKALRRLSYSCLFCWSWIVVGYVTNAVKDATRQLRWLPAAILDSVTCRLWKCQQKKSHLPPKRFWFFIFQSLIGSAIIFFERQFFSFDVISSRHFNLKRTFQT